MNTPALPASLRRTNQRTVISLLQKMGCASRADLAKAAGISQPTAGKIISYLLQLGVLQKASLSGECKGEAEISASPRLGRPGQLVRLDAERLRFMAVELGVSDTSIAALPLAATLRDQWTCRFRTPPTPDAWLQALRSSGVKTPASLWGVLISVPGIVDESAAKAIFSPNLHWLESANLLELLQQVWPVPVLLVQEIRALALGHLTAEPEVEDFFLVDFGQGVGGAIVCEGKLYSHPMPLSGEFGHTPIENNSRACGCGAVGCLETLVSEKGLLKSFSAATRLSKPTWKMLTDRVSQHGVEPWLAQTVEATARVIAGALNVLGLHRVVVTGTLAALPDCVLEHLRGAIIKGAMWARFGEVTCVAAPRRRAAGLVAVGIDRLVLPEDEESSLSLAPEPGAANGERRGRQVSPVTD